MTNLDIAMKRSDSTDAPAGFARTRTEVTIRLSRRDLQRLQDACFEAGDVRVPVLLARARHTLEENDDGVVHVLTWKNVLWDESILEVRILAGLIRVLKGGCRFEQKPAQYPEPKQVRYYTPRVRWCSARF